MISVIIPTHNSKISLKRALNSIFSQEYPDIEVVVVDDASNDGTERFIINEYPQVKFVKNHENQGAAFSRNRGIAKISGDWALFMDCDTELGKGFLENVNKIFSDLKDDIVAISPKIINRDKNTIFSCGLKISSLYRSRYIGKNKEVHAFNESFFIDGPNSCCAIFKRSFLEKIKDENGYFDQRFFIYFEDSDLALRLKNFGLKSIFSPKLMVYHQGNSSKIDKQKKQYFCFRNRFYMIFKNNNSMSLALFFIRSFFYDLIRCLYFMVTNKHALKAIREIIQLR